MLAKIEKLRHFFASHPLTRDRQFAAWGRFARWQIVSRMQAELIVPWVADLRLAARSGMHGATGNIYTGLHEFPDMMMVCHLLRVDDVFVDVGANIGSYSVLASGIGHARTIAFEPDPDTANQFRRNINVNELGALVELLEFAVGDGQRSIKFTMGRDTANKVAERGCSQTREVRQTTLDDVVADLSPVMIKADVEGYEEQVIRGAERTLRNLSLKVIELETVTEWICETLATHGFVVRHYDPFTRRLSETPVHKASNMLFVRDEQFVQHRLDTAAPLILHGRTI